MALMKCRECGREISDKAKVCPGCGAETAVGQRAEETKKKEFIAKKEEFIAKLRGALVVVGMMMSLWGIGTYISDTDNHRYNYEDPLTNHETGVLFLIIIGISLFFGTIIDAIIKSKKAKHSFKTEWQAPDLSALSEGGPSPMWICPDCSTKNKANSYTCNRCGFNRRKKA